MAAIRRHKLYFDIGLNFTQANQITTSTFVMLTPRNATTPGDRHGDLLPPLTALTGGSHPELKTKNDVMAWFQPTALINASEMPATSLQFVSPSQVALPYYTRGGSQVPSKVGHTPVFTRHFGVVVTGLRTLTAASSVATVRGILYVQRQHTIEV